MLNKNIFVKMQDLLISEKQMYQAYKLFFATLTSQSRLKIINLLRNGPKNVSEIQHKLRLEQTIVSHDLRRLKKCGFVYVEKKGKYRYYSLNEETIKPLMLLIDKHMDKFCKKIIAKKK
jgi:ArsR family transcriptional regulator